MQGRENNVMVKACLVPKVAFLTVDTYGKANAASAQFPDQIIMFGRCI